MKRLTKRLSNGEAMLDCDNCELQQSYECGEILCRDRLRNRVAAYEDTALEPEEVATVKLALMGKSIAAVEAFNGTPISRIIELAEADKTGRVIITDILATDADGSGLRQKYRVYKAKDNAPVSECFVLRPEKDSAACIAMEAYAKATENKTLSEDIFAAIGDSGRVIVLPCKVGDTLYEVTRRKTIAEYRVTAIRMELCGIFIEWKIEKGFAGRSAAGILPAEIGKTVFLTKEEADRELKRVKGW